MPVAVTDTDNGQGNVIRAWGHVSEPEFLDTLSEHYGQPTEKFAAYLFGLSDFSEIAAFDLSVQGVKAVAHMSVDLARKHPDLVVNVIAPRDMVFGLARMFEMLSNEAGWEISVFRDRGEAVARTRERVRDRFGVSVLDEAEVAAVLPSSSAGSTAGATTS